MGETPYKTVQNMMQDHPRHSQETKQYGRQDRPPDVVDRLTVTQAADRLGVSQDAVRKRIARGTIRYDKDAEGRVYVYLDTLERASKTYQDEGQDDASKTDQESTQDKYTRSLEGQIAFLRQELERKDTIILSLTQRLPELEPSSGLRQASATTSEGTGRGEDPPEHHPVERPSWWCRFFGLE